ncbi:4Fe-4S dicluster domain-containing protein [Selenihalanaerobacter shriftii]|uniref:Dissimilatory adenylylsulfate reductase beta subunit n=1 Tax=Selenihalanaerobacter shriftii TaxID=142842 RepID=A0A1T4NJ78_9FIRM|nr:4Fe-4S dicluster domain-containing protein [Selenihalanaerobacter shriftii]SJZ78798.1 dissimilatory adenylylsulfate reductase beta subunit [Selenihalanaerobacter shriftii]
MTVRIDKKLCNGCGNKDESCCMRICPGNLLYKTKNNKAEIRDKADCWDCAACVKECPRQAIEVYLPVEIGGRGSTLKAKDLGNEIVWTLKTQDGSVEEFTIRNKLWFNWNL